MVFPLNGGNAPIAVHPPVTSTPATQPGVGQMYTRTIAGIVEEFYMDSLGQEVQITSNGVVTGGGGGGASHTTGEVPTGDIDGTNPTFVIALAPIAGSVKVFKNGIRQQPGAGNDYTISGQTITFEAGNIPQVGNALLVDYLRP